MEVAMAEQSETGVSRADAAVRFHPESAADFLPLRQMRALQLQRLQAIVRRAYDRVPLYHQRMQERNVTPDDLGALADIARLPFTVKTDLRDTYPFGLFASPMEEVVRLHASSGTTGKPIVVAYTDADLKVWSSVMVRAFACYGLHRGDIIQNAYGYGLFTGGLGAHYGAEALGATVIPISGGNTERQIMVMKDFGVTAICCTPSYFVHLVEKALEMGIDMKSLPLRAGVFGAEPWTEAMRDYVQKHTSIRAYDVYGLSEIIGPGGWRPSASASAACTSLKTTSTPRSSTPRPARSCPMALRASSCSQPSPSRPCPCSAIARVTSPPSNAAPAAAAERFVESAASPGAAMT